MAPDVNFCPPSLPPKLKSWTRHCNCQNNNCYHDIPMPIYFRFQFQPGLKFFNSNVIGASGWERKQCIWILLKNSLVLLENKIWFLVSAGNIEETKFQQCVEVFKHPFVVLADLRYLVSQDVLMRCP